jgi:hypothetical protein
LKLSGSKIESSMDADLNLNDYNDLRLGQKYDDYYSLDVPEVSSYEDYEHLKVSGLYNRLKS